MSYIDLNDLGSFASINALWAAYPEGGQEGDYCTIASVIYRWDKYDRMWVADPNFGPTPARSVDTFYGDVNIHNNLTVAGTIRAKGINNPCVGFFPSEEALEEKWPTPKVGWWAIVGDTIPGEIYHCVTEGEWTDSGETGGSGEVDLTEYAKLTDIPEIADDLVTNTGTKTLSARQGKILNEKIPPVVDSLTSTSATSALSAKQGKVLNEKIPTVVDNLTSSSPISALSAKQGNILKTLIDNIGSINVQGIQGFWPIDSLNDLPLSPTEEQKKMAYLYENAIYIYVGEGGDTLGGKYKSTDLIDLDWGDKSYAPLDFSGLGRRWLKKNMVEGVNVLTSAMIGTANTEYFIQYDYEIEEVQTDPTDPDSKVRIINLPANSTLVFMGGSIKNGILVGNNTRIQAKKGVCIFDDITIQGTWDVAEAYSSWFKMHKKGYKIVDNSVTENAVTKYHGSDNVYHEPETLTAKSDVYFVKSTLSSGAVKVDSVFVPFLTLEFYRGSDNEQYSLSTLTPVSNVNFVKSTLGNGSNVVESSVFATATTATYYKGTDNKYYTSEQVTLVNDTYYVESTLDDGAVVSTSIAITSTETRYLASNGSYYASGSLQSVDSTYFVESTLDNGDVAVSSIFAVGVYKTNNDSYYSLGNLTLVGGPTNFVTDTLVSDDVSYDSVFTVSEVYSTFRVEGYNADSTIDYVAAPAGVPGIFDATSYTQYNDTAALQNLFDIRAKKTVVEDGIYMVNSNTRHDLGYTDNLGLLFDGQNDCELILEGWLKVIPNNLNNYYALNIIGCENIRLSGKGGIHGDLLEHTKTSGEAGMLLAVSNTKNLTVESLTFAYAWGDCVYEHNWRHGRQSISPASNAKQGFHTYKNVSIIYGGRTGYVSERGDNVVIDSCYFYGSGRVRGKATNSAIDIEPLPQIDSTMRFVRNYEFKNNVFKNSARGIRLERCFNCSVHDNDFDYGWNGVIVQWHKDASYNLTPYPNPELAYVKSYMKIYNNFFKRCTGITLGSRSVSSCENVEVFGNTFVSCQTMIEAAEVSRLVNCKIYNNTSYGSGGLFFHGPVIDCDIYNNNNYGCKMPILENNRGAGRIVYFYAFSDSQGSSFHDNHFSLDYGKSIYGLGEYGREEIYHGLPVGYGYRLCTGADLDSPEKIRFYNNKTSDDFHLLSTSTYDYTGNSHFGGGMCSIRNEASEVFLNGDIFRSSTYGDEGVVVKGGMISCSWLEDAREFEPDMEVAYGEIIKVGDYYRVCRVGGTCGETFDSGTAVFLGNDANGYVPDAASANRIEIVFTKRGVCTSETRPDSFLYAGRRMWETDTKKEIVYDGTDWVYNDIYTEE